MFDTILAEPKGHTREVPPRVAAERAAIARRVLAQVFSAASVAYESQPGGLLAVRRCRLSPSRTSGADVNAGCLRAAALASSCSGSSLGRRPGNMTRKLPSRLARCWRFSSSGAVSLF
jgi:hypothetical protein